MRNSLITSLFAAILVAGCSTNPPRPMREGALLSGEATATKAGDAARKAEKADATGLIYASSSPPPPVEPPVVDEQPAAAADVVVTIELAADGTLKRNGAPIEEDELLEALRADVATTPEVRVLLEPSPGVALERVKELDTKIRAVGVTQFEQKPAQAAESEPATEPKTAPQPELDAKPEPAPGPAPRSEPDEQK